MPARPTFAKMLKSQQLQFVFLERFNNNKKGPWLLHVTWLLRRRQVALRKSSQGKSILSRWHKDKRLCVVLSICVFLLSRSSACMCHLWHQPGGKIQLDVREYCNDSNEPDRIEAAIPTEHSDKVSQLHCGDLCTLWGLGALVPKSVQHLRSQRRMHE